ncbi:MAG: hypothetical protein KAX09_10305 [Candidatus Heimdallarchaeota archaeon]|nr:hypothetical protein [Candidatus Heimdallarchaeota archaeon]MCK4291362.1 hypothetical protein [Candidatus Heimdallarchaeota archaeon]
MAVEEETFSIDSGALGINICLFLCTLPFGLFIWWIFAWGYHDSAFSFDGELISTLVLFFVVPSLISGLINGLSDQSKKQRTIVTLVTGVVYFGLNIGATFLFFYGIFTNSGGNSRDLLPFLFWVLGSVGVYIISYVIGRMIFQRLRESSKSGS